MVEMPPMQELAELYGVQATYEDLFNAHRAGTPESLLRVLQSLGAPMARLEDAADAARWRRLEMARQVIEPVVVAWDGEAPELLLQLGAGLDTGAWSATLRLHSGGSRRSSGKLERLPVTGAREVEGERWVSRRLKLRLRAPLPFGYHRLRLELPGATLETLVISAPRQAYLPTGAVDGRMWGVFVPLYALQTARSLGAGDLADLATLLDWTGELGGDLVGTLPLLASFLDEPYAPSPYTPVSRLFWNELYVALEIIPELSGCARARDIMQSEGFRREVEELRAAPLVDYRRLMVLKRGVLEQLAESLFSGSSARREAFESFLEERPDADAYARFRAAVEKRGEVWSRWPAVMRDGTLAPGDYDEAARRYHLYAQWLMHEQMEAVATRAKAGGRGLYLDLPIGVHPDGYDVWRDRDVFLPGLSAGAPPDALAASGQNWGFPALNPEALRAQGHRYLGASLGHHLHSARALRIDHVMGLHRLFVIPTGLEAKDGLYISYPADELYAVLCLESTLHQALLIGEDLGTVPPYVRPALAGHGVQRMYVTQFELREDAEMAMPPVPATALASFDTHDTPTFAGFWLCHDLDTQVELGRLDEGGRRIERDRRDGLWRALERHLAERGWLRGEPGDLRELLAAVLRDLAASEAAALMINLENLWLEEAPQNVPGTCDERPNWQRKARHTLDVVREWPQVAQLLREISAMRKGTDPMAATRKSSSRARSAALEGPGTATEHEEALAVPASGGLAEAPLLTDDDIYLFNEGTHYRLYAKLGAHLATRDGVQGTYFAVWAPDAERVSVIGDFNRWQRGSHPLSPRGSSGIWDGFIPGVASGDIYKYLIESRYHMYKVEKSDPYGAFHEVPPKTASRVWQYGYAWGDAEWMANRGGRNHLEAPMSIYEVHLGSWMRVPEEDQRPLTYRELAHKLVPYIKEMGFTHVEMMPVMEHPFTGSWGYQVTGYFAPTSRYGTPDDFMYLVDELHKNGIGVILDWVPAHFPTDEHGLGYFDGTHLYEHADSRKGFHPDWQSWIFNYGRNEVRSFLLSSAVIWLDVFHADGLRVDGVASMLYLDYSRKEGEWIPNQYGGRENLEAISLLRQMNEVSYLNHPDIQNVAEESTAWPMVSRPTYLGGLGFGLKWDMGWMHDTLTYMSRDPIYRIYHHNELTFRMLYAFTENFVLPLSHDEVVHGKGSLLNKMPGDLWQKFANLRLLYAYMFAQPGKKLLFMGAEIAQWHEWSHDSSLDWHLLQWGSHRGVQRLIQDLNRLYRREPALHELDISGDGFEWIDANDAAASVFTFMRKARNGDIIAVACNMTPVPREGYQVGLPHGGTWTEILNTDAVEYDGGGIGNLGAVEATGEWHHGRPCSARLRLPPLGVVFLKKTAAS